MTARLNPVLHALWPPALFGALMLSAWQLVVRGFDMQPYFLVAPTDIWKALTTNWHNVWEAMQVSGTNAAVGLVFGTIAGVLMSFLLSRFRVADELVTPLSIAINAIPAFVLVSVFNNMFSSTSEVPRRLMVTSRAASIWRRFSSSAPQRFCSRAFSSGCNTRFNARAAIMR